MMRSANARSGARRADGTLVRAHARAAERAPMNLADPVLEPVDAVVDVRLLAPGTCRLHIEDAFERLPVGGAVELRVPHDPAPLRGRFAVERPGQSAWTYLEQGPLLWRVRVERRA